MALIKCKECGNAVSNTAKACPHCGATVPKSQAGCMTIIILGTIAIIGFIILDMDTTPTGTSTAPATSQSAEPRRDRPAGDEPESTSPFRLVDEQREDIPAKAQINQQVVIEGEVTADEVRAELQQRFREASLTRGWRHHARPTNVYIYIYQTEERAREAGPHWVGMLAWTSHGGASSPRIQVREPSLQSLASAPPGVESWRDDGPVFAGILWLDSSDGDQVMKRQFDDGSETERQVIAVEDPRGRRFNVVGRDDYYLINSDGNLEMRDSDGLIDTARKIEP
jgi:hypothetical protein